MPRLPALALSLILLGACGPREPQGMSREKFVRVNVALRMLPDSGADLPARRAALLRREHVTPEQLQQWVRTSRVATLVPVWKEIADRVDRAARADAAHRDSSRSDSTRSDSSRSDGAGPTAGAQVDVPLPPPPSTGGPQDTLLRPSATRPRPDTSARLQSPFRRRFPVRDTVRGRVKNRPPR
jgi:hypothetical protein